MNDDYNKPGMATFLVVLAFNVLFFVYISFIHEGVKDSDINKPAQTSKVNL